MSSSRGSSQPRGGTRTSYTAGRFLAAEPPGTPLGPSGHPQLMSGLGTRVFPRDFQDGLTLGSCSALRGAHVSFRLGRHGVGSPGSGLSLPAERVLYLHPFVLLHSHTGHFLEGHQCLGPEHAVLNITRSAPPAASPLVGSAAIPSPLIGGD